MADAHKAFRRNTSIMLYLYKGRASLYKESMVHFHHRKQSKEGKRRRLSDNALCLLLYLDSLMIINRLRYCQEIKGKKIFDCL